MKNILITGASGMVGSYVLQNCLKSTELGEAMFKVGMNGHEREILENKNIMEVLNS